MDSVNSSHDLTPQRFNRTYSTTPETSAQPGKTSSHVNANETMINAVNKSEKPETFSDLFGDKDLERLQQNLETIAELAESALKQFNGK